MHEKSALRAMSFDTGRVASGKSGNWMILADDGGSGSERGAVSFITAPRRSRLARKSGSLIVAAMDKSSWASIPFLLCRLLFFSPNILMKPRDVLLEKRPVAPRHFVDYAERSSVCSFSKT